MPVGMPLDNTAVFLLPQHEADIGNPVVQASDGQDGLEFAEHGSVGEVCIAGACVAAGYLEQSPMSGRYGSAISAKTLCPLAQPHVPS